MTKSFLAALVGSGVGPSLTPPLHEREAARLGLRYIYRSVDITAHDIAPEKVGALVAAARALGFNGLNITHPCKQLVIPHLDELAPEASAVGAVNTVVFRDGRAVGHNTDVTGFEKSFARGLATAATDLVVQVGAGGAGAAVANALLDLGTGHLVIVDREKRRAERLAEVLAARFGPDRVMPAAPDALSHLLADADGVVNATPVGMAAHPGSAVPGALLHSRLWVADIVYRPLSTQFVHEAEAAGCQVLTGAGMAVFQAIDAFELITGHAAVPERMFADFDDLISREAELGAGG